MTSSVLRGLNLVTSLAASLVLSLMCLALLPPAFALLVALVAAIALVALVLGVGESPVVQVLSRSRPVTDAQQQVLRPVAARLAEEGITISRWYVRRETGKDAPPAARIGREALVVTPWLVETRHQEQLSVDEAAALVAFAIGAAGRTRRRGEVAVLVATTPWRMVRAVTHRIGAALAWLPFVRLSWSLRWVLAVVCLVQSVVEGRAPAGVTAGVLIALTYLLPATTRAVSRRTERSADQFVVGVGLGPALAGLIRRHRLPVTEARLQGLEHGAQHPSSRPALRLVTA
ncbi:MAG: hypothetical protein L0H74_05950 [Brachybacterium sp.]|nr:hypothetical protein [Brachybacterium sp.]